VGGTPMTSIDMILLEDTWFVSVAVTQKENRPGPAATVPEIVPDGSKIKPRGRAVVGSPEQDPLLSALLGQAAKV
jgi:hypothetical protein